MGYDLSVVVVTLSLIWCICACGLRYAERHGGYNYVLSNSNVIRNRRKSRSITAVLSVILFFLVLSYAVTEFDSPDARNDLLVLGILAIVTFVLNILSVCAGFVWKVELKENELVYTNYIGIKRVYSYDDVGLLITKTSYKFYRWGQCCLTVRMNQENSYKIVRFFNNYHDRKMGLPTLSD